MYFPYLYVNRYYSTEIWPLSLDCLPYLFKYSCADNSQDLLTGKPFETPGHALITQREDSL